MAWKMLCDSICCLWSAKKGGQMELSRFAALFRWQHKVTGMSKSELLFSFALKSILSAGRLEVRGHTS